MMGLTVFLVFLGCIATGLTCQLSEVCDSACSSLQNYITDNRTRMNTRYRLQYHVAPPIGWMNDPNGFIYYKDKFHIFYQYYPYASKWGPMHWGHSTSSNLVDWETQITALVPGTELCFSGSATVLGTTLVLMYTGHVDGTTNDESQYLAFSDDGIHFHKYAGNPVLKFSPTGLTPDFRDPKLWKRGDYWYVVVGTKVNSKGRVLLYRSTDLLNWTYLSVLGESKNITNSAYMWECPDFFELNGKHIIMMSPQGMSQVNDRYKNLFQTGYIVGSFSYDNFQFTQEVDFQELDYGHDFYATQSIDHNGKRILIAWFGMWQESGANTALTEAADGWAGALTIFRELTLSDKRILMNPVAEMTSLRQAVVFNSTLVASTGEILLDQTGELIVKANWNVSVQLLLSGRSGGGNVILKWDFTSKKVVVDRQGDVRQVEWSPTASLSWRIYLDTSSLEMFCGNGDVVFSSRVYPLGGWKITNLSTQSLTVTAYSLRRSVPT